MTAKAAKREDLYRQALERIVAAGHAPHCQAPAYRVTRAEPTFKCRCAFAVAYRALGDKIGG